MRVHFGRIPENAAFLPGRDEWRPIKEPSPWMAQLLALPVAIITAIVLVVAWNLIVPTQDLSTPVDISLLVWIIGVAVVHETIHAMFHPGLGISFNTVLGFWPSKLVFYAHYDNVLSRNRFVAILMAPFVILSLMPLLGGLLAGTAPFYIIFVSVFNGLLSCVDILGVLLIVVMVPKSAFVRNKGWKTFYKMAEQSPAAYSSKAADGLTENTDERVRLQSERAGTTQ